MTQTIVNTVLAAALIIALLACWRKNRKLANYRATISDYRRLHKEHEAELSLARSAGACLLPALKQVTNDGAVVRVLLPYRDAAGNINGILIRRFDDPDTGFNIREAEELCDAMDSSIQQNNGLL